MKQKQLKKQKITTILKNIHKKYLKITSKNILNKTLLIINKKQYSNETTA